MRGLLHGPLAGQQRTANLVLRRPHPPSPHVRRYKYLGGPQNLKPRYHSKIVLGCTGSWETVHCIWKLVNIPTYPLDCAECCHVSSSFLCRSACRQVAEQDVSGVAAIELLITAGCGPPDPAEAFWTCLLKVLDIEKSLPFSPQVPPSIKSSFPLTAVTELPTLLAPVPA